MDFSDLYQDLILEHAKNPRNFGNCEQPTHAAQGHNPLCGDKINLSLSINENEEIIDIKFFGEACAVCTASASMMTENFLGKKISEAKIIFDFFHQLLTKDEPVSLKAEEDLEKLMAFSGVKNFPMRVKCATLAWHSFSAAIENKKEVISNE